MNQRISALVLSAMLLALSLPAEAQQQAKVSRIGYLISGARSDSNSFAYAFRDGLRDLGYVEGKNIVVEYRYAEGKNDRFPSLVAELVQLKVDVLVVTALPAILAAKQATKTIPIVMITTTDPVASGAVESLAHPGGNITGLVRLTRELNGKRLELLKEAAPKISRVGVLWVRGLRLEIAFKDYEVAARALKMPIQSLEVRGPSPDLDGAFQAAAKERASALITIGDALLNRYQQRITELAKRNRLPSVYDTSAWVEAGGLMSYSANDLEVFRRAAWYVDKILKGAKPAELPVEQPTKFEFVINLKTAKALNLMIPQSVLFRADKVIK